MNTPPLLQPDFIGREDELDTLKDALNNTFGGNGSTIFVAGEAGIGKTRIVSELIRHAESKGTQIMKGWCLAESLEPLMPVKTALREAGLFHLISGAPPPKVVSCYLMNENGLLLAKAEREGMGIDSDIFAGMLQAVGNFVQDSLSMMSEEGKGGLNSLGYQDHTILIQTYGTLSLAAVIKGEKCEFLIEDMKALLEDNASKFSDWDGDMSLTEDVELSWFIESGKYNGKFLVDDPKLKQENLFDNVLLGLQRQSLEKPTLLFFDDIQWADPTTLNLLHYLTRNIRNNRIQILGTYRPEDIVKSADGRPHPLEMTMQNMNRENLFDMIELERLDRGGTEAMINGTLGNVNFESGFIDRVFKGTEGTPFFILEVLKLLVENGAIAKDDGAWVLVAGMEELDIPSKIYDVVKRRLDRLKKEQREILECASVVGEEFASSVVGNMVGLDKIKLLKSLGEVEKTHKLIQFREDRYKFDHAKIREVLYNGIGSELRREYHRMAGEIIAELNKDDEDELVNVLAYHYYEAGDERAPEYLLRAGDIAKERYANEEAVSLYRNALKFLKDEWKIIETYENLGDVNFLIGDFSATIDEYGRALEMEGDDKAKAAIHKKMSGVHVKAGEFQQSKEECDLGLELLKGEDSTEMAQLLESQGWTYVRTGDYENAAEILFKSLRIAENLRDPKATSDAHHTIGSMSLNKGEFEDALEHLETALSIRVEIDDTMGQSATLNNIGVVHYNKGEMDKALRYYEQSLEINEKIGHKWGISSAFNNIGLVHSDMGELDKALEYYLLSLGMDKRIGDKSGVASTLNNIGNIYNRKGDPENALEHHTKSLGIREGIGDKTGIAASHINLGNICMAKDAFTGAVEHFNKSLEIGNEIGDKWLLGHVYFCLAESTLALGDSETALEHASKGLELSTKIGAKREEGMNRKALGMIYREREEWSRSEEEFEKARIIFEDIRDKNVLTRLYYEYGLMWKAKGEPGKARELIEKALGMCEEMGMRLWVEKCRGALEGF